MTRARPSLAVAVFLAAALTACRSGAPTTPHAPKASASGATTIAAKSPVPGLVSPTPGVATPAPSIRAAFTLVGHILVPAQIIANNGGSIIGDSGGSIVANNGGSRRLLSTTQAPVANVAVALVDAAGNAIPGTQTRTDATGAYAITAALPDRNLVLTATLPGTAGAVQAIVPPGATQVDGDVVSTLTTGYILNQYARTQPDPVATLDKLPADVEAATRQKAAAALTAVPDALTSQKVVAAVEGLRKQDKALDDQLELVRKLLIPAGQSDLGTGQLALEVALEPGMLAVAPDGALVIVEQAGTRVWALRAGRMVNLAGSGGVRHDSGDPALEGADATKVPLAPYRIAFDAAGRLVIAEYDRLTRVDAQGKLHLVGSFGSDSLRAMAPGDGDEVLAILSGSGAARLVAYAPGKPERVIKRFTGADLTFFQNQEEVGGQGQWDAHGKLVFTYYTGTDGQERRSFDLATQAFGPVEQVPVDGRTWYDAAGNRFESLGTRITVTSAGGSPRVVTTKFVAENLNGGTLAADGAVYVSGNSQIYRVEADGGLTPVAGLAGVKKGDANAISFGNPAGVAVAADGTLFVSDQGTSQIVRVGTDHLAKVYAGIAVDKVVGAPLQEGAALQVSLGFPTAPHLDAAGNLYCVSDMLRIIKVTPAGQVVTAYTPAQQPTDLAVAPNGTLYVASNAGVPMLERVAPDGTATPLLTDPPGDNLHDLRLGLAPDGTLFIAGNGQLRTWTAAGGVKLVRTDARFSNTVQVVPDARGRLYYVSDGDPVILRFDNPATGEPTKVAGPGTRHFAGSGADDGLANPMGLAFNTAGDLYFADGGHKQVKKILAGEL